MSLTRTGLGQALNSSRTTIEGTYIVSILDRYFWRSGGDEGRRRELTNHDAPIQTAERAWAWCDPSTSLTIFATKMASGVRGNSTRLRGQIDIRPAGQARGVTQFDLDSGILRGGRVARFLTSWRYPMASGWWNGSGIRYDFWDIGEIYFDDSEWVMDLISLRDRTRRKQGPVASRLCQNELGVVLNAANGNHLSRCTKDLTTSPFSLPSVAISQVDSRTKLTFQVASDPGVTNGYYSRGRIKVLSGEMKDLKFPILNHVVKPGNLLHEIELALPLPRDLVAGTDTLTIVTGCDHSATTCKMKFDNIKDLRADQLMPGQDIAIQPGSSAF